MNLKSFLIPCEENDYQPWVTKASALAAFCLIIWGIRVLVPVSFSFAAPGIDANDVMQRINNERTQRFIPALITNNKLVSAAAIKSGDMLKRSYFAHVNPDGNYVWPTIEASGYAPYLTLGENLAIDFFSASSVVEAWMNSATHRANILNEKFQDQGLSAIYGNFEPNHDTITITSLFGTLLKKTSTTAPSNTTTQPKTTTPKATSAPPAATPTQPQPQPQAQVVEPKPEPEKKPSITIKNIKVGATTFAQTTALEVEAVVDGPASEVWATVMGKTEKLLASSIVGQYLGVITFPAGTKFDEEKIFVQATDSQNNKTSEELSLAYLKETSGVAGSNELLTGSAENEFVKILRIVFGAFAGIYLFFLIIDSLIIYKAKLKRTTMHSSTHSLLFFLIAIINIFGSRF